MSSRLQSCSMTIVCTIVSASGETAPGPESASTEFSYSVTKPYSVLVKFVPHGGITWEFERQLLKDGIEEGSGAGDVRFARTGDRVAMLLMSPHGFAMLGFDRGDLTAFLKATTRICGIGEENMADTVNSAITRLLADGR